MSIKLVLYDTKEKIKYIMDYADIHVLNGLWICERRVVSAMGKSCVRSVESSNMQ